MTKDKIKQAFEDKIGEGGYGHLLYKNFGGQYADSHVASQWDGFRWGYEAALAALHTYDPATHVAVPREPTDDVLNAMLQPLELGNAHDVYEAMISAAEVRD